MGTSSTKTIRVSLEHARQLESLSSLTGCDVRYYADRALANFLNDEAPILRQKAKEAEDILRRARAIK